MARILVFDSGVGGLSVLSALQGNVEMQTGPQHQWLFCSDNAFFPYGTRKEDELVARVLQVLTTLQDQHRPDVIVLACNTASTVALGAMRERLRVPVVGVVPAIKPAAALSASRCIGLLATPATIQRPYTQQLIDDFAADCRIVRVGSSELVSMAEEQLRSGMVDQTRLHQILAPLRDAISQHRLDTVVLACTHFPLLRESLQEQLPEVKHWVDSREGVARRVAWCLAQQQEQREQQELQPVTNSAGLALFTRLDDHAEKLRQALRYFGLTELRQLSVPLFDL